jgi:hypothetical protein
VSEVTENTKLTCPEKEELDQVRSHVLRFKWLAEDCKTWDEVITAIQEYIDFIKDLDAKQARIIQNDSDYLYYTIPGEHGVYATYEGTKEGNWVFLLPDGRTVTYPIDPDFDALDHTPKGTRIATRLNAAGEIRAFHVSFHQP